MNYNELVKLLHENSDEKYNRFNAAIVNSSVPTMGVRLPTVRKIAKSVMVDEALSYPAHEYLEVDAIVGIVLSSAKLPFEEKSALLTKFAQTIENWSVCDCNTVKVPKAERKQYFQFFKSMLPSAMPFVCRYGVVNLLANYLDDEYINAVFDSLQTIVTFGHYYVDMAVAWLVATAAAKCRDVTFAYLVGDGKRVLNVFTYNKALQKMRDSYRISDDDKAATYALKRSE